MTVFATCTAATCLSTGAVVEIIGILGGCWGLGYGIGNAQRWVAKLRDAA